MICYTYNFWACRAGAEWVVGAEVNQSMCDAGVESLVMNGLAGKCLMVNKDVRRMYAAATAQPDGTPPDMLHKADLAVFEVRALQVVWSFCHHGMHDACYTRMQVQ